MRPLPLLAATLLVVFTTAARAAPLFLDILPPGQDGLVPASTVTAGAHATDQLAMYRDLPLAAPGLGESDLARFFKDASIGAPALPQRVETPRAGVTVARDAFGVPHVMGATRGDVFLAPATSRPRIASSSPTRSATWAAAASRSLPGTCAT